MTHPSPRAAGRSRAKKRSPQEFTRPDRPTPGNRGLRPWVLLGLLAAGSFGATFALVTRSRQPADSPSDGPPGTVWIPGGEFTMGTDSELGREDEKPAHRVRVDGFWMDEAEVTNSQFRAFVEATGYVTTAEKPVDLAEIMRQSPAGAPPPEKKLLVPGSLVFVGTREPVGT